MKWEREVAASEVSFDVSPHERLLLLGPSGAGKSSILRTLIGLRAPAAGSVVLFGGESNAGVRGTESIGYVPDAPVFDRIPVAGMIRWCSGFHPAWNHERAAALQSLFGIEGSRRCDRLSSFESCGLSLLLALAHEPPLLIIDDPARTLEPGERQRFWSAVSAGLADRPGAAILASSALSGPISSASSLMVLRQGRVALAGEIGELEARVRRIEFVNEGEDARCLDLWFCHKVKIRGRELELLVDNFDEATWRRFIESPGVAEARATPVGLEELYAELVRERKTPGEARLEARTRHVS